MNDLASVMSLKLTLTAEDANRNLHKFRGKAHLVHEYFRDMPLSPGGAQRGADAGVGWAPGRLVGYWAAPRCKD
jgi:hypothetical protein